MKHSFQLVAMVLLLLTAVSFQVQAENQKEVSISIYRIAPGKHLDFLKWIAEREAADKEAGVPATQWYSHLSGDSWDYLAVGPVTTPDQDKKVEELLSKKGLVTGFKAGLQFRQFASSHTDTRALGPMSAADLVKAAE